MARRSQHTSIRLQSYRITDQTVYLHVRLAAGTDRSHQQPYGPILTLALPQAFWLDQEICDHGNLRWQMKWADEERNSRHDVELEQDPLF